MIIHDPKRLDEQGEWIAKRQAFLDGYYERTGRKWVNHCTRDRL